ncbi:MAG: hypothetical protein AB1491_00210 [Thermodesulfobacteriota bacterium]
MAETKLNPYPSRSLFLGIDPGRKGGAGIVDDQGACVHSWRWKDSDPLYTWYHLCEYRDLLINIYIEAVRLFPALPKNVLLNTQALLLNAGRWMGMLDVLQVPYQLISVDEWQAHYNLTRWRKRKARIDRVLTQGHVKLSPHTPGPTTPLSLARTFWPQAPLKTQADDGMAVGLLLADMARQHHLQNFKPQPQTELWP